MTEMKQNLRERVVVMEPTQYAVLDPSKGNGAANTKQIEGYKEYSKDPELFVKNGLKQWWAQRKIIEGFADVCGLHGSRGAIDGVFTADPSISITAQAHEDDTPQRVTIYSKFTNTERQVEIDSHIELHKVLRTDGVHLKRVFNSEGTGDNYFDSYRRLFWSGFIKDPKRETAASGRSDIKSHMSLAHATGIEVISIPTKKGFFHIDTGMSPLSRGHIVVCKDALGDGGYERVIEKGCTRFGMDPKEFIIDVDKKDADDHYACNLQCFGNNVVIPECSEDLINKIRDKGYNVYPVNMRNFILCGGAVHCTAQRIDEFAGPVAPMVEDGHHDPRTHKSPALTLELP